MLRTIGIKSNFYDYYDFLSDNESDLVYNRVYNDGMNIGSSLRFLRQVGIRTIEIGSVRDMASKSSRLNVYMGLDEQLNKNPVLMDSSEAIIMYPNYQASRVQEEFTEVIYKFLQVGRRRFSMILSKDTTGNEVVSNLRELVGGYSRIIGDRPIFSIDYINTNDGMLASRLNYVQSLSALGLESIVEPRDVVEEIYTILYWNKIGGG